jgi:hypothetical protein
MEAAKDSGMPQGDQLRVAEMHLTPLRSQGV